jgi:kumamolisin
LFTLRLTLINDLLTQLPLLSMIPSVISISWGGPEQIPSIPESSNMSEWSPRSIDTMDQAFQEAAALGVTVCEAAGDSGSGDGVGDRNYHADFPASSPYVLACGGTTLNSSNGAIESEVVWNDGQGWAGGGMISDHFPKPDFQSKCNVPKSPNPGKFVGRGIPDVAGVADPAT